ncbi:DEKNAAC104920 [Brettanomyces naardenensis]|uniref:DEKNAAC104920 n=1 Tax=Brettanomyces naardenensis TaxID=13370 RepID=A0A448YS37_BRENA|nr:DEKNAAC104920 [Brettanomyces naardenensis]
MNWLLSYLVTYLLGGVTFVPLLIIAVWFSLPKVPETEAEEEQAIRNRKDEESLEKGFPEGYSSLKTTEIYYENDVGVKTDFSGWLTVTLEFYKLPQVHSEQYKSNASFNDKDNYESNGSGFVKIVKDKSSSIGKDPQQDPDRADARQLKQVRKRSRFYAVLRHGNLFLYKDETLEDVQRVIVLTNYFVTMWPRNLTDARLFTKYTAICLLKKEVYQSQSDGKAKPLSSKELLYLLRKGTENTLLPAGSCFLYGDTNHEKEDWYFALLRATSKQISASSFESDEDDVLDPTLNAKPWFFNTADIMQLLQTINSTEGQLSTKWLNALVGRLFLSVYKTRTFRQGIKRRVDEKLRRIRTPGFLDELQIGKIDVGNSAPFITYPELKSLSPEGKMDLEMVVDYAGGLTVEVSTKVFLNLGTHFRQREFDVNLKVILRRLHGKVLVRMKPLPSNRIWYSFTSSPEMDLDIEPVVSSRTINYNLVTKMIERRFKDAVKASLVYPFMDDIVFFQAPKEIFRGGIWDHSVGKTHPATVHENGLLLKADSFSKSTNSRSSSQLSVNSKDLSNKEDTHSVNSASQKEAASVCMDHASSNNEISTTPTLLIEKDEFDKESISTSSMHSRASFAASLRRKSSRLGLGSSVDSRPDEISLESEKSDFSLAAVQIKNGVSTSVSKLKSWYKKTSQNSHNNDMPSNYSPPEMISNRRRRESSFNVHSSSPMYGSESITGVQQQPVNVQVSPPSPEMFISEKFKSDSTSIAFPLSHPSEKHDDNASEHSETSSADVHGKLLEHEHEHDSGTSGTRFVVPAASASPEGDVDLQNLSQPSPQVGPVVQDALRTSFVKPIIPKASEVDLPEARTAADPVAVPMDSPATELTPPPRANLAIRNLSHRRPPPAPHTEEQE